MAVQVLGIAGSPRRKGNTDLLLEQVMLGAASGGAETRTIVLSKMNIAPCRHCDGCLATGVCVIDDDMQKLHVDLRQVERIVIASPVFFAGVTAQTKAMIDRCQALWAIKYLLKKQVSLIPKERRRGLYVSVGGTHVHDLFGPSLATIKVWFWTLEMALAGQVTYSSIDESGAIKLHPEALKEAFAAGVKLASD